jgi:hypothetical protein
MNRMMLVLALLWITIILTSCIVAPKLPEFKIPETKQLECPKPTQCPVTEVAECPKVDLPPPIPKVFTVQRNYTKYKADKAGAELVRWYAATRKSIQEKWYDH